MFRTNSVTNEKDAYDLWREHLEICSKRMREKYPHLEVWQVPADCTDGYSNLCPEGKLLHKAAFGY